MAQEYKPGDIVPQSDICTITHDPVHADMPREVTIIKRRRFSTMAARTWVTARSGKHRQPHPDLPLAQHWRFELASRCAY
jgi:hypothetical protein